jgi:CHASE1-domain containing sensor protein
MFKWKLFWLILALGAVASFLVSGTVRVMEDRRAHNLFGQQSELLHQALEANIKRCVGELDSLASLYNSSDHVTKDEFESFAQVIVGNNSSIRALEWVPHVPARERKRFETEKFDGETPSVGINEESTTGRIPAGRREHYAPVYYVCPLEKNEKPLPLRPVPANGVTSRDSWWVYLTSRPS